MEQEKCHFSYLNYQLVDKIEIDITGFEHRVLNQESAVLPLRHKVFTEIKYFYLIYKSKT